MDENKQHKAEQAVKEQYGEGIQDHPNFNVLVEEAMKEKPRPKKK